MHPADLLQIIDSDDARALLQSPANAGIWGDAARKLIESSNIPPAVTFFKRALACGPEDAPKKLYRLAMAEELAGDFAAASGTYIRAAAAGPARFHAATHRAIGCLQRMGDLEGIANLTAGTSPADWRGYESMFSLIACAWMHVRHPATALRWVCADRRVKDTGGEYFRVAGTIVKSCSRIENTAALRDLLVSSARQIFTAAPLMRLILPWIVRCGAGEEFSRILVSPELIAASDGKCLQAAIRYRSRHAETEILSGARMALIWDPVDDLAVRMLLPDLKQSDKSPAADNRRWSKAAIILPGIPEDIVNQAVILQKKLDDEDITTRYLLRAAQKHLSCPQILYNSASYLNQKAFAEEAKILLQRALLLDPSYAKAFSSLSISYATLHDGEMAVKLSRASLICNPTLESGYTNLAMAYRCIPDLERARDAGQQQVRRFPDDAVARLGLAFNQLTMGAIEQGFENYLCRWANRDFPNSKRSFPQKEWTLQQLPKGRKVLIYMEQGMGDEFMFSWFLKYLEERIPGQIVVEADNRLLNIFRRSFPDIEFFPRGAPLHSRLLEKDILYKLPIGHLPNFFTTRLRDLIRARWDLAMRFPVRGHGWIYPDAPGRAAWSRELARHGGDRSLTVGVAWRSGSINRQRASQYVTPRELVNSLPDGCLAINLQYVYEREETEEIELLAAKRDIRFVTLPGLDLKDDLDGVLDLCAALDVIVTPMTSTAFMGGALGVPTLVFRCSESRSIWQQLGTPHIPWLPSLHLFFRTSRESWETVTGDIRSALGEHHSWLMGENPRDNLPAE